MDTSKLFLNRLQCSVVLRSMAAEKCVGNNFHTSAVLSFENHATESTGSNKMMFLLCSNQWELTMLLGSSASHGEGADLCSGRWHFISNNYDLAYLLWVMNRCRQQSTQCCLLLSAIYTSVSALPGLPWTYWWRWLLRYQSYSWDATALRSATIASVLHWHVWSEEDAGLTKQWFITSVLQRIFL